MKIAKKIFLSSIMFLVLGSASFSYAVEVESFSPDLYNSNEAIMNSNLGISGWQIENLEDDIFLPGFSYSICNPGYPAVAQRENGAASWSWDGDWVLNLSNGEFELNFPNAAQVGFGLSDVDVTDGTEVVFRVNDDPFPYSVSFLPGFSSDDGGHGSHYRNIYIKIDGEGTPISEITFSGNGTIMNETIYVDHIAVVPEPASLIFISTGVVGLFFFHRLRIV